MAYGPKVTITTPRGRISEFNTYSAASMFLGEREDFIDRKVINNRRSFKHGTMTVKVLR